MAVSASRVPGCMRIPAVTLTASNVFADTKRTFINGYRVCCFRLPPTVRVNALASSNASAGRTTMTLDERSAVRYSQPRNIPHWRDDTVER
jgi:hypothetical protein